MVVLARPLPWGSPRPHGRAAPERVSLGRRVFAPCHAEIPPWPFFQGCVFDHCHMPDTDVLCSGLELYAALCASLGVCIDWRGRTNHTCRECFSPARRAPPVGQGPSACGQGTGTLGNQWVGLGGHGGLLGGGGLSPGQSACVSWREKSRHPGQRAWVQGAGWQARAPTCQLLQGTEQAPGSKSSLADPAWALLWCSPAPAPAQVCSVLRAAFPCPADTVYQPCGPSNPPYCYMSNSANAL